MARLTRDDVLKKAEALKNWGKWGSDDELGVLNYITPEDIVNAARLVKKGKVFRLGLELDENGPQRGIFGGRWNPMHQMLATGTDAVAGKHDVTPGLRYADDAINLPTQAATQWDALSHVFLVDKMWNGYPATLVDSRGAHRNGIEKFANKMVGRGVLLDVARWKGVACLADGYGITVADLDATAQAQGVTVRRADFVIIRTGQMEDRLRAASGAATPAATRRGSRSRRSTGSTASRSPASAATPGESRSGPTTPGPTSSSPGTGSRSPRSGSCTARSST
jgi:hypothetical protein